MFSTFQLLPGRLRATLCCWVLHLFARLFHGHSAFRSRFHCSFPDVLFGSSFSAISLFLFGVFGFMVRFFTAGCRWGSTVVVSRVVAVVFDFVSSSSSFPCHHRFLCFLHHHRDSPHHHHFHHHRCHINIITVASAVFVLRILSLPHFDVDVASLSPEHRRPLSPILLVIRLLGV